MTELERAMANLERARDRGLIDIKLFVQDAKNFSKEEIFAGVNRIDAAINAGECEVTEKWPHDIEPKPFGPLMD